MWHKQWFQQISVWDFTQWWQCRNKVGGWRKKIGKTCWCNTWAFPITADIWFESKWVGLEWVYKVLLCQSQLLPGLFWSWLQLGWIGCIFSQPKSNPSLCLCLMFPLGTRNRTNKSLCMFTLHRNSPSQKPLLARIWWWLPKYDCPSYLPFYLLVNIWTIICCFQNIRYTTAKYCNLSSLGLGESGWLR